MMKPLELLKEQLQKSLNESTESNYYRQAIHDGIYACTLGSHKALEGWCETWTATAELPIDCQIDEKYLQGVAFVEEKWHQITGLF